ncbi:MAG: glycine betaine/L-proline ABC transporter substrate-binding protein ProX [Acidimicrobiaceae bacterium]|nr:glycine betaine/L-proline ABC transporter substrate-binding protein ProX [Acidimicrobiaceae bacterium]
MRTTRGRALVAVLLTFGLLAAACGDDAEPATTAPDDADAAAASAAAEAEPEPESEMALPGEGVSVTMGRGNWPEANFHHYVLQQLLQELGYDVTDPEEIAPATFYPALAQGDYDLWASGWTINHTPLLEGESPDGGTFADKARFIGTMMAAGALQGLLVDIPSVEQYGFSTLGELLDNPDAVAHFDSDGDGRADINGCDDGWGCQKVINDTLAKNGWDDRAAQVSATHSALFVESQASYAEGGPVLQYVWTPAAFIGKLVPGRDVLWLAIEPEQTLEGQDGVSSVGDACTKDPCTTMFTPSPITAAANKDFLAANPAAASLLEDFEMDPLAVAVQAVAIDAGADPNDDMAAAATEWIANNRDTIDPWIEAALAAG